MCSDPERYPENRNGDHDRDILLSCIYLMSKSTHTSLAPAIACCARWLLRDQACCQLAAAATAQAWQTTMHEAHAVPRGDEEGRFSLRAAQGLGDADCPGLAHRSPQCSAGSEVACGLDMASTSSSEACRTWGGQWEKGRGNVNDSHAARFAK
jgi:hypothetical protein